MKKILAIILASLMIFSLAACGSKDDVDNETKSNANENQTENTDTEKSTEKEEEKKEEEEKEEKLPTSDDEIFKYISEALNASTNYNDSVTVTATANLNSTSMHGTESQENKGTQAYILSYNSTDKTIYQEENYEMGDTKKEMYGKTILDGNNLYLYTKEISSNKSEIEEHLGIADEQYKEKYQSIEALNPFYYPSEFYRGIKYAESFSELKDAVDNTLPIIMKAEYSAGVGITDIKTSSEIYTKSADKVYSLVIDFKSSAESTEDSSTMESIVNFSYEISAKDGKIIEYKLTFESGNKSTQDNTVVSNSTRMQDINMTYDYSFAKDKYDALEVNIPEDTSSIEAIGNSSIDIYVNGIEEEYVYVSDIRNCNTSQEVFEAIISQIDTEKGNFKIFADEAMTQEITEDNVTKEMILGLSKLYVELTPKSDYALLMISFSGREDYSNPYKIILPLLAPIGVDSTYSEYEYQYISSPIYFDFDTSYISNDNRELWINGVKYDSTETGMMLEAGKTYKIEYIKIASDKDFN